MPTHKSEPGITNYHSQSLTEISNISQSTGVDEMEKSIRVVAHYYYKAGYFVEVSQENSVIAGRDYWLCKKNSNRKLFMFSSPFRNDETEEKQIISHIKDSVQKYEEPMLKHA